MSGTRRDYYEVLGVPPTASAGEIHRASRSLARELHPDVNRTHDAAAQFDELSSAYAALHDPRERARYDRSSLRVRRGGSPRRSQARAYTRQAPTFTSRQPRPDLPRLADEEVTLNFSLVIRLRNPFRWLR